MSGTFGRGKMKRMQSTPLIMSRPNCENNTAAAVNLSPIFSADAASIMTTHNDLGALSTFYCEKIDDLTSKTEMNNFSHWFGPKTTSALKNPLDGTYVENLPELIVNPSNKENANKNIMESDDAAIRPNLEIQSVLSDILNKQNGPPPSKSNKISIAINKQSSSVWLNSNKDYAKEPCNETDDKDMEELHTELDKILDQLQKLVT